MKAILSVVMSFAVVMLIGASGAWAQDKAKAVAPAAKAEKGMAARKVVAENDKVIAFEIRQKPGEQNKPTATKMRVVRFLTSGTILRTYADGKTETKTWKAGEVEIQAPGPEYTTKNTGKSEILIYAVVLK